MQITLSPDALALIRQHGGRLTIYPQSRCAFCEELMPEPRCRAAGPPEDLENYDIQQADGITIYLHKDLALFPGRLQIDQDNLYGFANLRGFYQMA